MRSRRSEAALALAGLLLAGCVAPPAPEAPASGPVVREFARPGGVLRRRLEVLAARCWMDDELGAEALGVDRGTGRIVAAGPQGAMLTVTVRETRDGTALVRLSGPALEDAPRRARMARALETVLEGPEPAC